MLQQLLQDRDASVAEAGRSVLAQWLERDCGGDPLQLLQLLDVETYTGAPLHAARVLGARMRLQLCLVSTTAVCTCTWLLRDTSQLLSNGLLIVVECM